MNSNLSHWVTSPKRSWIPIRGGESIFKQSILVFFSAISNPLLENYIFQLDFIKLKVQTFNKHKKIESMFTLDTFYMISQKMHSPRFCFVVWPPMSSIKYKDISSSPSRRTPVYGINSESFYPSLSYPCLTLMNQEMSYIVFNTALVVLQQHSQKISNLQSLIKLKDLFYRYTGNLNW